MFCVINHRVLVFACVRPAYRNVHERYTHTNAVSSYFANRFCCLRRWLTLTEYVKYLGREGKAHVDQVSSPRTSTPLFAKGFLRPHFCTG